MADVTIIGAGLAGLACATRLAQSGIDFQILEATERIGGRVRTDVVEGFTLDHGFQVLLTAYPACRELLDYNALRLRPFDPGALVRIGDTFHVLGDPWRKPTQALKTALAPVESLVDKLRIGRLRAACRSGSLEDLYTRPANETQTRLRELGFSDAMIEHFFRPFFGGVFLENELTTSSRMMEFVFRMFSSGPVAVPADGMAAIPRQLAEKLPRGCIMLNETVQKIDADGVRMSDGRLLKTKKVVVATESTAIQPLLGADLQTTEFQQRGWNRTLCHYYTADQPPFMEKMLALRGDDNLGPINNVAVLSNVAPEYAPAGKSLISVSVSSTLVQQHAATDLESDLVATTGQLKNWFGPQTETWKHLRTFHIPYALPQQELLHLEPVVRTVQPWGDSGPIVCGDHRETSSIQGALNSGLRAATAVLRQIQTP